MDLRYIITIPIITGFLIFLIFNHFNEITNAIILATLTISITVFIALTQQNQLNKLKDIGNQTRDTTEKLKTDEKIREAVKDFFGIKNNNINKEKKYKCFFPVEYKSKPLPFIDQGDFYALHVLHTRLGEENIDLLDVTKNESIDKNLLENNTIFICTPARNPALKKIFDTFKVKDYENDKDKLKNWLNSLNLPCWFVDDFTNGSVVRKIFISNKKIVGLLESEAEESYEKASEKKEGEKFKPDEVIQKDYGIFARLNKDNYQYIIIAGIHQYGTWIVASLLSNLLSGEKVHYGMTFKSNKDFIAVITGEFDNDKLTVNNKTIEVYQHYCWTKEKDANKWNREFD